MDGRSGAKEKSFAPRKLTPAEQPLEACERCLRQKTPLTYEAAVLTF
jgi:hypothetical protein